MRRPLTFACEGATLAGTLHPAGGRTGVVIVTGGVQTRHGSHRGFVVLAERLAEAGYPVLRYDRRGVGDSDGEDAGFRAMSPDIAAAVAAFRAACPDVTRLVGWGLCDGASALAMNPGGFAGLILANPWTLDSDRSDPLPPRAAIGAHYAGRLTSPRAWLRLLSGGVSLRPLLAGLAKLATPVPLSGTLADMSAGLGAFPGPILVLLAQSDATAQAFASVFRSRPFRAVSDRSTIVTIAGATHTFPGAASETAMIDACLAWLGQFGSGSADGANSRMPAVPGLP